MTDAVQISLDQIVPGKPAPSELVHVPLSDLRPIPPDWPRPDADMRNTVKEHGILNAIRVERMPNGTLLVVDGRRRVRAADEAGLEEVPALVRPYDPNRFLTAAEGLTANANRSPNFRTELSWIEDLLLLYGSEGPDALAWIRTHTGLSATTIKARLGLRRLVPEARELLNTGQLRSRRAEELSRLDPERQRLVLRKAEAGEPITAEVIAEAKRARASAATLELPGMVFAPEESRRTSWRDVGTSSLDELLSVMEAQSAPARLCDRVRKLRETIASTQSANETES